MISEKLKQEFITFMMCYDFDDVHVEFPFFSNTIDEDDIMVYRHNGLVRLPHASHRTPNRSYFILTEKGAEIVWDYVLAFRKL